MESDQVLVFPRRIFDDCFSLVRWDSIQDKLSEIQNSYSWLVRSHAEQANEWVQPIPCAFIRDHSGRYCVLRRVKNDRDDLNAKISLIVGGHIDESHGQMTFNEVLSSNLKRELDEEVGVSTIEEPRPVGVIVDNSSIRASRHVAFLHEITADRVYPRAKEEFATKSIYTGQFLFADQLKKLHGQFDPWSRLLIEDYIFQRQVRPQPRQRSFLD